ncbi:MAG TPA: hypothetical protein VFI54_10645 [Solirubrobacteraceae bacterium]|nr:hypothetical protein [Solirubrobacteraceae bacterium]
MALEGEELSVPNVFAREHRPDGAIACMALEGEELGASWILRARR